MIDQTHNAGHELATRVVDSNLRISGKSVLIASKQEIAEPIIGWFKRRGITMNYSTVGRDLGVGTSAGKWRVASFITQRIISTKGRVSRSPIRHQSDPYLTHI